MPSSSGIRLQKLLSAAGVASRRAAEALMREGRVTVNGLVVSTPGTRADPARDDIRIDGRRIGAAEPRRYLLLNKPRGYVTTRRDPQRRPTVIDLLPNVREYVYPIGRLDFDSEGLLLLTNDGVLAARLTHPRHGVPRVYEALVGGVPDTRAIRRLTQGIVLDGCSTSPATIELVRASRRPRGDVATLRITIREGRYRQVRRMCEAVGHPVIQLRRIQIGPIRDRTLKPGHARDLRPREIDALRRATQGGATGDTDASHRRRH